MGPPNRTGFIRGKSHLWGQLGLLAWLWPQFTPSPELLPGYHTEIPLPIKHCHLDTDVPKIKLLTPTGSTPHQVTPFPGFPVSVNVHSVLQSLWTKKKKNQPNKNGVIFPSPFLSHHTLNTSLHPVPASDPLASYHVISSLVLATSCPHSPFPTEAEGLPQCTSGHITPWLRPSTASSVTHTSTGSYVISLLLPWLHWPPCRANSYLRTSF